MVLLEIMKNIISEFCHINYIFAASVQVLILCGKKEQKKIFVLVDVDNFCELRLPSNSD